jgi:selenocysteine lyase/cysteine desulfurase
VAEAVERFLPWYSSVHRGTGWKSQSSTAALEAARDQVAQLVGARGDDAVVFASNTTHALNTLATALPAGCRVVAFEGEHHANLLPWRRHDMTTLPVPGDAASAVGCLDDALSAMPPGPTLVAVTGASNVTGEIWPVTALCSVAHRHGAQLVVDAAQLAPHAPVDIAAADIDWIALSAHKLYAPYGSGALVGRRTWLDSGEPLLRGGGAVRFVTRDEVVWDDVPARYEAGSPNVIGAVAFGAACSALREYGMSRVLDEEQRLLGYAAQRMAAVPGLTRYVQWPEAQERIAVLTFNITGLHHGLLAAALSAEYGIAVRAGCFCAHPLLLKLLQVPPAEAARIQDELRRGMDADLPGAVRISAGLASQESDIDAVAEGLAALASDGPRWNYRPIGGGHYVPDPDDREPFTLAVTG